MHSSHDTNEYYAKKSESHADGSLVPNSGRVTQANNVFTGLMVYIVGLATIKLQFIAPNGY